MDFMWLYSVCQCCLFVCVVVMSVRLCMAVSGSGKLPDIQDGIRSDRLQPGSVSCCLRLCLGCVGAIGGAIEVPVTVVLNLRSPQCLYTCIILVCCPLLVRQFTMFLFMLLTLDTHLQHSLANRYSSVVTRQRALCVVLLCWLGSILSSFAQFIGTDILDKWRSGIKGVGAYKIAHADNWTTSLPQLTTSPLPKYHHDLKIIGENLPYGGFWSKFYVEDMSNFTYAEIHSSHWGVCDPDAILTPQFLVYVHGVTIFLLPLLCLLAIYLDLLCTKSRKAALRHGDLPKHDSRLVRSMTLSLSLLVLLCSPLHVVHTVLLFAPGTYLPFWVHPVVLFLFQLYSLVPPILFTPPRKQVNGEQASFPPAISNLPPTLPQPRGKPARVVLREATQAAPWSSAKHSLKAKVCPEV